MFCAAAFSVFQETNDVIELMDKGGELGVGELLHCLEGEELRAHAVEERVELVEVDFLVVEVLEAGGGFEGKLL